MGFATFEPKNKGSETKTTENFGHTTSVYVLMCLGFGSKARAPFASFVLNTTSGFVRTESENDRRSTNFCEGQETTNPTDGSITSWIKRIESIYCVPQGSRWWQLWGEDDDDDGNHVMVVVKWSLEMELEIQTVQIVFPWNTSDIQSFNPLRRSQKWEYLRW